jgi:hypothetical protein
MLYNDMCYTLSMQFLTLVYATRIWFQIHYGVLDIEFYFHVQMEGYEVKTFICKRRRSTTKMIISSCKICF